MYIIIMLIMIIYHSYKALVYLCLLMLWLKYFYEKLKGEIVTVDPGVGGHQVCLI